MARQVCPQWSSSHRSADQQQFATENEASDDVREKAALLDADECQLSGPYLRRPGCVRFLDHPGSRSSLQAAHTPG
jgi:hypothetical protein